MQPKIALSYKVRQTTREEKDAHMPYLTSSMIEAIVTCPRWGIFHSVQRKRLVTGYRQMALEAGSLMHEVFSIYNLWQVAVTQKQPDHAIFHGQDIFGKDRFDALSFTTNVTKDAPIALDKLAYAVIETSEFYDDPNDKNRTRANLSHCAVELGPYFLMRHAAFGIYVEDETDPTSRIGIEQSLDVVFEIVTDTGEVLLQRFIGLADAVYQNQNTGRVTLGEYKTTSSMNDGWREAFRTRHQLTGYNAALQAYFDNVSLETILTGSTIPVRKTTTAVDHFVVDRYEQNILEFLTAAMFAQELVYTYNNEAVLNAPMFTHSCNRYFRPCSLLDLCTADKDDQLIMWMEAAIADDLSPSEMKALLRRD